MSQRNTENTPSGRRIYEATLSGAQDRPPIPRLRSDPPPYHPLPHTLDEFREAEGREARKGRLQELWKRLPMLTLRDRGTHLHNTSKPGDTDELTVEKAESLKAIYNQELLGHCGQGSGVQPGRIGWKEFKEYAQAKEVGELECCQVAKFFVIELAIELWSIFHDELDLDGNGHLDAQELTLALSKAGKLTVQELYVLPDHSTQGIKLSPRTLSEFMTTLTSSPHSHTISFAEFRDFLLLLPRKASPAEIYQYYEVSKFMGDDGRGAARVTMEGI